MFDIWIMLSWNIHCCCYTHLHMQALSCPPPLILPSSIRRSRVQTRPHPRSSDGVMEWAGLARCCCSLWGCDSHWAQSSLYIGSRSKVRITLTQHRVSWSWGWLITPICFREWNSLPILLPTKWTFKTFWNNMESQDILSQYINIIYYGCIVYNIQYSAWYYWLHIP